MKNITILSSALLLIFSCNKKLDETKIKDVTEDSQVVNSSDISVEEITSTCYFDDIKNDSVYLKITDNLGTITGKLRYKNYQKDSSNGDVMGFMSGDTLKLNYIFNSEGVSSTREIWFLKKNNLLVEGIGDQDGEGNYTNIKDIRFENGHSLQPEDCQKLEKYFK